MKNQRGFTLIELVMVILLLGILAAVAIPRFWDLGTSADQAAAKGGIGGIKSGVSIYNASVRLLPSPPTVLYPGNPINTDVLSDLFVKTGYDATPGTCTNMTGGQWGVNTSAAATQIYYRWKSSSKYSSWSYSSADGIVRGSDGAAGSDPLEAACS